VEAGTAAVHNMGYRTKPADHDRFMID